MSQDASYPAVWDGGQATFTAANGTDCKVVLHRSLAGQAIGAITSTGGHRAIDVTAVSADAASKDVVLYNGKALTVRDAAGTGTITLAASTATRVNGDWRNEGWRIGDLVALFAPPTQAALAQEGKIGVVTGLTATVLTVNGTPWGAETLSTDGVMAVRLSPRGRLTPDAASVAGTPNAGGSKGLIGSVLDPTADRTGMGLGPNELLIAQMATAVAALPAYVSVDARELRY